MEELITLTDLIVVSMSPMALADEASNGSVWPSSLFQSPSHNKNSVFALSHVENSLGKKALISY
jgi:hypothetical protein